jgi:hypothetical protein
LPIKLSIHGGGMMTGKNIFSAKSQAVMLCISGMTAQSFSRRNSETWWVQKICLEMHHYAIASA